MTKENNTVIDHLPDPFADAPCILEDVPHDVYLQIPAFSASGAKTIKAKSMAHFKYEMENPSPPTRPMVRGTAFHEKVLEPDKNAYRVMPAIAGRNSNAAKRALIDFYSEAFEIEVHAPTHKMAEGKYLDAILELMEPQIKACPYYAISEEDNKITTAMRDALMRKKIARIIFEDGGRSELTLLWESHVHVEMPNGEHETVIVPEKARVDYMANAHHAMGDLKSIDDCSWENINNKAWRYGYDLQCAQYTDGALACGFGEIPFIVFSVESEPPHDCRILGFSPEDIAQAMQDKTAAIAEYARSLATGVYPGYPDEIDCYQRPRWARR